MGIESCSCLPFKNINVGDVHEERMGFINQEAREVMVGVSWPPLETSLFPAPLHSLPANHRQEDGDFPVANNTAAPADSALTPQKASGRGEGRERRMKAGLLEASGSRPGWEPVNTD